MNLLELFNKKTDNDLNYREQLIERLLSQGHINTHEALVLMRTIDIKIEAQTLEMSSGAKIIGGSDFETNNR